MDNYFERYLNTDNIGLQYYYLLNIYNKDNSNINILFLLLEYCIYLGTNIESNKYINVINNRVGINNTYFNYLLNKYNSINIFNNIEYIKDSIKLNKLYNEDYYLFIENSEKMYKETLNPEYLYLLGQKSYFNGNYKRSVYYFDKYIDKGVLSLRETYIYLFYITSSEAYLNKLCNLIMYNNIELKVVEDVLLKSKDKYINKEIISLFHNIYREDISNKPKKLTINN